MAKATAVTVPELFDWESVQPISHGIKSVKVDPKFQARKGGHNNQEVVNEYTELLKENPKFNFPPVRIVRVEKDENFTDILVDGFHRIAAYMGAQRAKIPALIMDGTEDDAIREAAAANQGHGIRRTHEDIRRAVKIADQSPTLKALSVRELGTIIGVSHGTVHNYRTGKGSTKGAPVVDKNPKFGNLRYPLDMSSQLDESLGDYFTAQVSETKKSVQFFTLEDKRRVRLVMEVLDPLKEKKEKKPKAEKATTAKGAKKPKAAPKAKAGDENEGSQEVPEDY